MQAQSYSATGKQMLSHRAQGEFYFVQGSLAAAAEQLELGRRAGDGDFYQMSSLEARLREMRTSLEDEIKRR
jgi:predicted Zn-dependent protease